MAKHRKRSPSKARYYITGLSALGITLSSTPSALAAPDPFPNAITEDIWDRLAECESSGDWDIDTGNGYEGGLQFAPSTWSDFGGMAYAPSAASATREEQIAVATRVQRSQGWNAWPTCTRKLGITGDPPAVTGSSVPSDDSNSDRPRPSSDETPAVPRSTEDRETVSAQANPKCVELKAAGTDVDELAGLDSANPEWGLDGDGDGVPCGTTFSREEAGSTEPVNETSSVSSADVSSAVVDSARDWTGVPYRWGGTSISGVDCSGLVLNVLRDIGVTPPRTSAAQAEWVDRISRDEARPGDLVFGTTGGRVTHVGIYTGDGKMIDAPRKGKTVGEHKLYKNMTIFGRVPT